MKPRDVLIWGGATAQAKVITPILQFCGHKLKLFVDINPKTPHIFPGVETVCGSDEIERRLKKGNLPTHFVVAVAKCGATRCEIAEKLCAYGMEPLTLIHPKSWVSESAVIGSGCQILACSAISESAKLGPQTIVNTNAVIDHDTQVGKGCHIMPSATVTGEVVIEDFVNVGSNATILPRLKIGERAFIGAGSVVTKDIAAGKIVKGIPAR